MQLILTHGAPQDSIGNDGDYALEPDNAVLYGPKVAGAWPTEGNELELDDDFSGDYVDLDNKPAEISYQFEYDFDEDGGDVGTIVLRGDDPLPSGFVVTAAFKKISTVPDSENSTATAALTSGQSANDLLTATIVSNAVWTTQPTAKLSVVIDITAERHPALVIAGEDLTQGAFTLHIQGYKV